MFIFSIHSLVYTFFQIEKFIIYFVVFIEFLILLLLCYVLVLWPQGTWDLTSQPGIEPMPSGLEGEVLTTGLQGNPYHIFKKVILFMFSSFIILAIF